MRFLSLESPLYRPECPLLPVEILWKSIFGKRIPYFGAPRTGPFPAVATVERCCCELPHSVRAVGSGPLEQVFPFFSNPSNLPRIRPPGLRTRLVRLRLMRSTVGPEGSTDHPGLAGVGSEIVTSFRIFPWHPWRAEWIAQVVGFEWNHHFEDVQKKGPFKSLLSST